MTRKERYINNLENIKDKYNDNIVLVDSNIEYMKRLDKAYFKCIKHDHIFLSSIELLLNVHTTQGCPLCKTEILTETGTRNAINRWSKNISHKD